VDLTICLEITSHTMVDASLCRSFVSTNLSQVNGYLKCESREAFQDNEALRSMSMVMSGPYSFGLSSRINNFINSNILSLRTPHTYSMHDSHLVCYFPLNSLHQFYDSHGRFYDRIETWLERYYLDRIPMSYHCHMFNMVNIFYHALIFPTFILSLFQVLCLIFCLEHMYVGLGLQG
jgi:hypothetical protein